MSHHWYMPLDVGKWFADSRISSMSSSQRGIFIDLKCRMHDDDRCGLICKTFEQVVQLARCTASELRDGLETLKSLFEVTERDGLITVVDLEMRKEWKIRKNRELRNKRYRTKEAVSSIGETPSETTTRRDSFNYGCDSVLKPPERGSGGEPTRNGVHAGGVPIADEFMEAWNSIKGVVACREMTKERKEKLATRLKVQQWATDWPAAMIRVDKSSFCKGGGDRGWRADIDWILRPGTLNQIFEGKYDDRKTKQDSPQQELKVFAAPVSL